MILYFNDFHVNSELSAMTAWMKLLDWPMTKTCVPPYHFWERMLLASTINTCSQYNYPTIEYAALTNAGLYSVDPNLQLCLPSRLPLRNETLLCRMWLGMAFTNAHSCLQGIASSSACNISACEETLQHILCRCPAYQSERRIREDKLRQLDSRPLTETILELCIRAKPRKSSCAF